MDILMNIEPVTLSRDLKALRKLHDVVQSNVRSLSALGVDSASYGSLLSSVLLNKLPLICNSWPVENSQKEIWT